MNPPDTQSLFDTEEFWRRDPSAALGALLASHAFADSSKKAGAGTDASDKPPRTMAGGSTKVYCSMFLKYARHVEVHGQAWSQKHARDKKTVIDADARDVNHFLTQTIGQVAAETLNRYIRLLERVHDHLVARGWQARNPVTECVKQLIKSGGFNALRLGRRPPADPSIAVAAVAGLRLWLTTQGRSALLDGDWARARDLTLASLSIGTGLRFAELQQLSRQQVAMPPDMPSAPAVNTAIELNLPVWASVPTARGHRVFATGDCAHMLLAWCTARWAIGEGISTIPGELIFPANEEGNKLSAPQLYRSLKALGAEAVKAGVLVHSDQWVLSTGAQGLRRAYVLSELAKGKEKELLTERLGHWRQRSVKKYDEAVRRGRRGVRTLPQ